MWDEYQQKMCIDTSSIPVISLPQSIFSEKKTSDNGLVVTAKTPYSLLRRDECNGYDKPYALSSLHNAGFIEGEMDYVRNLLKECDQNDIDDTALVQLKKRCLSTYLDLLRNTLSFSVGEPSSFYQTLFRTTSQSVSSSAVGENAPSSSAAAAAAAAAVCGVSQNGYSTPDCNASGYHESFPEEPFSSNLIQGLLREVSSVTESLQTIHHAALNEQIQKLRKDFLQKYKEELLSLLKKNNVYA